MTDTVVTRFAPSPTGYLHIGGARTALFNWLFARSLNGKMYLRIEDTDRARSTPEAIDAILDGLSWLEIQWDGEPVYQHSRSDRHKEIAHRLLAEGKAYKCYCSPEELTDMRKRARAEGRPPIYDGTWRDRDSSDAPPGVLPAIRFKAPRQGETIIDDQVQGIVKFQNSVLDDLILLRSDGSPTYMLSVVVDDHDMGVTHVIRGDDHLTNAARQVQIFRGLDWSLPVFAHVPLIHGPDGAKLSKRHGALGVEAYRAMGYLPAALRNYLVRLGWSHGDDEIISTPQMIEWFGLESIGRAPARFDFAKLQHINSYYINHAPDQELIDRLKSTLPEFSGGEDLGRILQPADWQKIEKAMPVLKERASTLTELLEKAEFIYLRRPLELNKKAKDILAQDTAEHLEPLATELGALTGWDSEQIEALVRNYVETHELQFGKIAQTLRAALTGGVDSPGIFDVFAVLGREEALGRLGDQIQENY